MNDFEQRLSDVMARKAAAADVSPEPDFLHTRAAVRSAGARAARWTTPRLVAVAAAVVVLVVGVVLTITVGRDAPDSVDGGPGGGITVYYQRVEMTQSAQLDCEHPVGATSATESVVIETYSDRIGRRWRSVVTYPDGSTYEWVYLGSALFPTASGERGVIEQNEVSCTWANSQDTNGWGLSVSPSFYSLDMIRELAPDEVPYMLPLERRGTRFEGETDSLGRPAVVWRRVNDGTMSYSGGPELQAHQVDEWYVDAADTDHIIERRYSDTTPGFGTYTSTEVMVADGDMTVDGDFFDTDGYTMHGPVERPDLSGGDGTTETTASATEFLLTDALMELGVDLATAPADAITIGDAEFCGWEEVTYADTTPDTEAQQCILDAHAAARSAVYATGSTTKDGDPLVLVYRTDGGVATMFADFTRDRFGPGGWDTVACDDLVSNTYTEGGIEVPSVWCTTNG